MGVWVFKFYIGACRKFPTEFLRSGLVTKNYAGVLLHDATHTLLYLTLSSYTKTLACPIVFDSRTQTLGTISQLSRAKF